LLQIPHFGRHYRTTPLLAGTRRLYRRIQCEDIGLECDAVDHADNVDDLSRTLLIAPMVRRLAIPPDTTRPSLTATFKADTPNSWPANFGGRSPLYLHFLQSSVT
jgi:hypothetical protein